MTVSTWAGTGSSGTQDGIGVNAQLNTNELCLDAIHNLIFVTSGSTSIRQISLSNVSVTTIAQGNVFNFIFHSLDFKLFLFLFRLFV